MTPRFAHELRHQCRRSLEDLALLQAKAVTNLLRSRHFILVSKGVLKKTWRK